MGRFIESISIGDTVDPWTTTECLYCGDPIYVSRADSVTVKSERDLVCFGCEGCISDAELETALRHLQALHLRLQQDSEYKWSGYSDKVEEFIRGFGC
jgi:hypothetical protein